jgi:endonuclease/exonuclease/phosphatase family metal-dependent hydrolase
MNWFQRLLAPIVFLPAMALAPLSAQAWPDMPVLNTDIAPATRLCDAVDPSLPGLDPSKAECRAVYTVLGQFTDAAAPAGPLTVMSWNIERGRLWGQQLDLFGSVLPMPDVLLLSEVDRGCERSGGLDIARVYAERLQMRHVVYATEFLETRVNASGKREYACEHGNAILSRYPLTDVGAFFFTSKTRAYLIGGVSSENRLGGRSAVKATVVAGGKRLQVFSTHLESFSLYEKFRQAQARELQQRAAALPVPTVIAGDLNDFLFSLTGGASPMRASFLKTGYADAHQGFVGRRSTIKDPLRLVIDFVYVKGAAFSSAGICPEAACYPVSDHRAVWTAVTL